MSSRIKLFMNDLGFRSESMPPLIFNKMAYFLKAFDTFVLCARALGEDAGLTSLLTRIDQVFSRNAEIVKFHSPGAIPADLGADLKSFEIEMDGWYTRLSNSLHSRSPTLVHVIEIIDSVLEDLRNFHCVEFSDTGDDSEGMEEKLQLFRNFIEFVEMLNAEHQQLEEEGFVIQVASVAVNAAHVCARLHGLFDAWNVQGWKQVKHGWKQIQPQILALLQRIRPISGEVSEAYQTALSISTFSEELRYSLDLDPGQYSSVVAIKDFIDFLLWCLWETLEMDSFLGDSMKDQLPPLWRGLKILRSHEFYGENVRDFRMAICEAGIILFSPHHQYSGVARLVENFKTIAIQAKEKSRELEQVPETLMGHDLLPQTSLPDRVVGITDEEVSSILDILTRGDWFNREGKHLRSISIVGMGGLGKTTLALHIYNHPFIVNYFEHRAWCTVSQVFDRKKLVFELLNQIQPNGSPHYLDMSEDALDLKLRLSLQGKRYFLIFDDVWDQSVWESLWMCFPDDGRGSRILLTSRHRDVAGHAWNGPIPYLLRPRSDVESLEILKTKLFPESDFPVILHELGMQIAKSCQGLPMTIVEVARLLTTPKPAVWKKVLESLNSNSLSTTEKFINSMELSYKYLPDHLKLCLLYFSLFSEKDHISAKWLYSLWIAEGFVHEKWIAKGNLKDLIDKSLVIVIEKGSSGWVKTCRVHESIHGFCIKKAQEEAFSHFLKGYNEILTADQLCGSQRLCIQSSRRDFKSLRLSRPDVHSLLFLPLKGTWPRVADDVSFIVRVFKSLRVLHIRHIDLGEVFPAEMMLLVELRYLAVRGHFVDLPSSIGNLSKLETLILDAHLKITLPGSIWGLHKLRHLCIKNGFSFPFDNLSNCSDLLRLESCSVLFVESWDNLGRLMKKFPNVSRLKLKCRLLDTINAPDSLHQLESLHESMVGALLHSHQFEFNVASELQRLTLKDLELSDSGISAGGRLPCLELNGVVHHYHQFELNGASQLKRLTLKDLVLNESLISSVGKLPRLESLKLFHVSFSGGGLHMEEEDFQELKYFKLSDSNILRWTAANDSLPSLQKLVMQRCICLEEIPSSLENPFMLERIELLHCSPLVESLVKDIAKAREEYFGKYLSISITPYPEKDFQ